MTGITTLGSGTSTKILKSESHKLANEFEVEANKSLITLSADLVAADTVSVSVNGVAMSAPVAYATSHTATMTAIAAAIAALSTVTSATVSAARVITIVPVDQENTPAIYVTVVNGGAGTAVATVSQDVNTIYRGMQVKLTTDGKITPLAAGDSPHLCIGWSTHDAVGGELATISLKGYAIIWGQASNDSHLAGPVKYDGFDTATKLPKYDDASVTINNIQGWAIDTGDAGAEIRIIALG